MKHLWLLITVMFLFNCRNFGISNKNKFQYEIIDQGSYASGYVKPQNRVLDNQIEFKNVWDSIHSVEPSDKPIPLIDFDKHAVLFFASGRDSHGGSILRFKDVKEKRNEVILYLYLKSKKRKIDSPVTPVITNQYLLIKINRKDKPFRVEYIPENSN